MLAPRISVTIPSGGAAASTFFGKLDCSGRSFRAEDDGGDEFMVSSFSTSPLPGLSSVEHYRFVDQRSF